MIKLREIIGKKLVSFLRGGDFAHPGEAEAIDLVMGEFTKKSNQQILDAGCGLGGTANYIKQHGWGKVSAFDIEKASIDYAKKTYPDVAFYLADVVNIHNIITDIKFDIICMFNSFYAFPDQAIALECLNRICKNGGKLVIFDYAKIVNDTATPQAKKNINIGQLVSASGPFTPIMPAEINKLLTNSGWETRSLVDISEKYFTWYHNLVSTLKTKENDVIKLYGYEAYIRAYNTYSQMLDAIKDNILGGIIIYAEKC